MILPDRFLSADRSLLGVGADLIGLILEAPGTVAYLWQRILLDCDGERVRSFDEIVLTLSFLHALGAVHSVGGFIRLRGAAAVISDDRPTAGDKAVESVIPDLAARVGDRPCGSSGNRTFDFYDALSSEAAAASERLRDLSVKLMGEETALLRLEKAIEEPDHRWRPEVERMYAAAGIVLPGMVVAALDSVLAFHASVIANRRHHLGEEIAARRRRAATIREDMRTCADVVEGCARSHSGAVPPMPASLAG